MKTSSNAPTEPFRDWCQWSLWGPGLHGKILPRDRQRLGNYALRVQKQKVCIDFLLFVSFWFYFLDSWKQIIYIILWELFINTSVIKEAQKYESKYGKSTWQNYFLCTKIEGYFFQLSQVRIIFPYKSKYWEKLNN